MNIVLVIGSAGIHAELQSRLESEKTAHGEPITLVLLDKSDGVAEPDKAFTKFAREAAIKEYFFGDAKRTLSPFTQSVSFDDVAIFKTPEGNAPVPMTNYLYMANALQTQTTTTPRQASSLPRSQRRCHTGHSQS